MIHLTFPNDLYMESGVLPSLIDPELEPQDEYFFHCKENEKESIDYVPEKKTTTELKCTVVMEEIRSEKRVLISNGENIMSKPYAYRVKVQMDAGYHGSYTPTFELYNYKTTDIELMNPSSSFTIEHKNTFQYRVRGTVEYVYHIRFLVTSFHFQRSEFIFCVVLESENKNELEDVEVYQSPNFRLLARKNPKFKRVDPPMKKQKTQPITMDD